MNRKNLISLLALMSLPAISAEPPGPAPAPKAPIEKAGPKEKPAEEPKGPKPVAADPKEKLTPADRLVMVGDAGTPPPKKK